MNRIRASQQDVAAFGERRVTVAVRESGGDSGGDTASRAMRPKQTERCVVKLQPAIGVFPARFVLINLAAELTGLTPKAIRRKIANGVWQVNSANGQGGQYCRGPDGRLYVDLHGYCRWVASRK